MMINLRIILLMLSFVAGCSTKQQVEGGSQTREVSTCIESILIECSGSVDKTIKNEVITLYATLNNKQKVAYIGCRFNCKFKPFILLNSTYINDYNVANRKVIVYLKGTEYLIVSSSSKNEILINSISSEDLDSAKQLMRELLNCLED